MNLDSKKLWSLSSKKNLDPKKNKKFWSLSSKKKEFRLWNRFPHIDFIAFFLLKCCLFDTKIYIYDLENSLQTYRFLHKKTAYPQKMIEKYICMKVVQGLSYFFWNLDFFLGIRLFFSFFIFLIFFLFF